MLEQVVDIENPLIKLIALSHHILFLKTMYQWICTIRWLFPNTGILKILKTPSYTVADKRYNTRFATTEDSNTLCAQRGKTTISSVQNVQRPLYSRRHSFCAQRSHCFCAHSFKTSIITAQRDNARTVGAQRMRTATAHYNYEHCQRPPHYLCTSADHYIFSAQRQRPLFASTTTLSLHA